MAKDLAKIARDKKIAYFLISFVDLFGVLRAKLVPAAAIGPMQRDGATFAGFATHLDLTPADPDVFAIPDPETLIQLPWQPELGWLAADPYINGQPIDHAPRIVLKRQIAAAATSGHRMKTGVEAEFFVIQPDGAGIADVADRQAKPCYDQAALLRRYDLLKAINDAMLALGWGPYQTDHEDANGQFEMNWTYDDCLITADRHVFFKFMVKRLAEQHGLRATFMPKPFSNLTGNGCHAHVSVWNQAGDKNLFHDPKGELGLSALAYRFLGGILHNGEALTALFTPTVNSFKRINAAPTCRARPGRPTRSATAPTTAPTWCASPSPAASSCG
jgi:glutamine synthetase